MVAAVLNVCFQVFILRWQIQPCHSWSTSGCETSGRVLLPWSPVVCRSLGGIWWNAFNCVASEFRVNVLSYSRHEIVEHGGDGGVLLIKQGEVRGERPSTSRLTPTRRDGVNLSFDAGWCHGNEADAQNPTCSTVSGSSQLHRHVCARVLHGRQTVNSLLHG